MTTQIPVSQHLYEQVDVTLRRLDLEHRVAQRGLIGVLTVSILGLFIVGWLVTLAMKGAVQLSGSELVHIILALLASIAANAFMYGAFVYRRIAKLETDLTAGRGSVAIGETRE